MSSFEQPKQFWSIDVTGLSDGSRARSRLRVQTMRAGSRFIAAMNANSPSIMIDSPELGRQLTALFDEPIALDQSFHVDLDEAGNANSSLHWHSIDNDSPVHFVSEPLASAWRLWMARLLGALAPESPL